MTRAGRDEPSPSRRRVTATPARSLAVPNRKAMDSEADVVGVIYLRTLIRAQLRLGIVCGVGFILAMTTAAVIIATVPTLEETTVFGVPWSWVLQAYGMYPLLALFAALYVRAATRNEKRYRSLEEEG